MIPTVIPPSVEQSSNIGAVESSIEQQSGFSIGTTDQGIPKSSISSTGPGISSSGPLGFGSNSATSSTSSNPPSLSAGAGAAVLSGSVTNGIIEIPQIPQPLRLHV